MKLHSGAGKTSFCASLQSRRAGFAKNHPSFDGEDLENTEFMKQWIIDLSQEKLKCPCIQDENKHCDTILKIVPIPEKILRSKKLGRQRRKSSADDTGEGIVIKATDCAGDAEYVLLSTLAINSKSVNVVVFDVTKYHKHETNYYSAVGCYLDIILSQTKQAVVCIVASHFDDDLPHNHFLKKNESAELNTIFQEAIKQIKDRTKDWDVNLAKITLLSNTSTKLFTLSNKKKNNRSKGLINSQLILGNALAYVANNKSIIDITSQSEGVPNLWIKLDHAMKEAARANQLYVCSRENALRLFNSLKESSALPRSHDENVKKELNAERSIITNLLKVLEYFDKNPVEQNDETLQDSALKDAQLLQDLLLANEGQKGHVISRDNPSKQNDDIDVADSEVLETIDSSSSSEREKSSDLDVVLDYLQYANEIFLFKGYKNQIFPVPNAFVNSSGLFLARDVKKWKEYIMTIQNGIIHQNVYDNALKCRRNAECRKDPSKKYVDFEEFKKFLLKMGVMIDYNWYKDDGEKDVIFPVSLKHQQNMSGLKFIDTMLFIPSLTNLPIDEYVRKQTFVVPDGQNISEVIRHNFTQRSGIEILFKWDRHCFTTVSIVNLLLVQLFTQENWNIDLSKDARIYKEKLENRRPGVVSLIEFDANLILIEEENLDKDAFYTNRTISIFATDSILERFQTQNLKDIDAIFWRSVWHSVNRIENMLHLDTCDVTFEHQV